MISELQIIQLFFHRDFSNVFKAFIGSNYLGMPYAFAQSGIIAGLFGLFLIAGTFGCATRILYVNL